MRLSELGVSPQKEKQFANKGITTAEELLLFLPRKYKNYTKPGALTRIRLMNHRIVNGKKTFLAINGLLDGDRQICVTWFNQEYMWQDLCAYVGQYVWVPTDEIKWDEYREQYSITVPSVFCTAAKKPGIVPIYPQIPGMSAEYHLSKMDNESLIFDSAAISELARPAGLHHNTTNLAWQGTCLDLCPEDSDAWFVCNLLYGEAGGIIRIMQRGRKTITKGYRTEAVRSPAMYRQSLANAGWVEIIYISLSVRTDLRITTSKKPADIECNLHRC